MSNDDHPAANQALISLAPGTRPREILARALAAPALSLSTSIEFDPDRPARQGGGLLAPGANELSVPADDGSMVRRVTPEQLLALVANIIANAPDAARACVMLRQEVMGWRFQGRDGAID